MAKTSYAAIRRRQRIVKLLVYAVLGGALFYNSSVIAVWYYGNNAEQSFQQANNYFADKLFDKAQAKYRDVVASDDSLEAVQAFLPAQIRRKESEQYHQVVAAARQKLGNWDKLLADDYTELTKGRRAGRGYDERKSELYSKEGMTGSQSVIEEKEAPGLLPAKRSVAAAATIKKVAPPTQPVKRQVKKSAPQQSKSQSKNAAQMINEKEGKLQSSQPSWMKK